MGFKGKKSSLAVGLLFILTAFVNMQIPAGAAGQPPVASAGGPYESFECTSILFDASGSYNPEGAPLTYSWNIDGVWYSTSEIKYEYLWRNVYSGSVTLEVSDGDLTATDTAEVTVLNVPPVITSIDGPTEVVLGTEVPLSVTFFDGSSDVRQIPSLDTYLANFTWDDGSWTEYPLGAEEFFVSDSHMYSNGGVYHINISISDNNGGIAYAVWTVIVLGDSFFVDAGPDVTIDEGSTFVSAGSLADTKPIAYTVIADYGDGSGPQPLSLNVGNTFDLQHLYYENGVYPVLVTAFYENVEMGSDGALVTVNNVPPTIISLLGSPTGLVRLGDAISLAGVFTDPGVLDSHVALVEWGDGLTTTVDLPAGVYQVSGSHMYASAGAYTISLTVTDDDGGSDSKTLDYNIVDIDAGPDAFIDEGDMFTSAGFFICSGDGLYTATVDYGDGSGPQLLSLSPGYLFGLSHQYVENGLYTVVVAIFKDGVPYISDSALVIVYNVAPIITTLSESPTTPVHFGVEINLVGEFTDPGILDSHIALIEWGDNKTTIVDLPAGVYKVNQSHVYASAGVYTITLTVTDDDGGSDSESINIVIYKPCCGFHTGCGWVKCTFDSKCKKGHTTPCDKIESQCHLAHLDVHSHVYEWLSIIGKKMTCKGVGH